MVGQRLFVKHHTQEDVMPYTIEITDILLYSTFEEALTNLPIHEVLPIEGITVKKGVEIYKQYVSLQTQHKDGVMMLKFKLDSQPCQYVQMESSCQ